MYYYHLCQVLRQEICLLLLALLTVRLSATTRITGDLLIVIFIWQCLKMNWYFFYFMIVYKT